MKESLLLFLILSVCAGCGKDPLFDNLAESRVAIVVKGTYESNNPRGWLSSVVDDDAMSIYPPSAVSSSIKPAGYDALPTRFMLDIAEFKLDGQRFANYRSVGVYDMTDTDPLFSGVGVAVRCDDVRVNKTYSNLQIYMRKFAFNNAHAFDLTNGTYLQAMESYFHESKVSGYDFNYYQILSFYDNLKKDRDYVNRVFPINVPVSESFVFNNKKEHVLEVRFVVKNFIKRYELMSTTDTARLSNHYFAFSDWARDKKPGDEFFGGNVQTAARWYVKGETATVTGNVPAGSYVIAIPESHALSDYTLSSAARTRPADKYSPRRASYGNGDMISLLEGDLEQQKWRGDYISYYDILKNNFDDYTGTWNNYNTAFDSFKIPPLATYTVNGSFVFENVPTGRPYKYYYCSASSVDMGELPSSFSGSGTAITVPESYNGGTFSAGSL